MTDQSALAPIVLVEDDEVDVMVVRRALRAAGIQPPLHHYSDGEQARDALRAGAVSSDYLLVLDLNLPYLSGFELLEELLGEGRIDARQVVIMSTSDRESDVRRAQDLQVRDYVCKSEAGAMRRLLDCYVTYTRST